MASASNASTYEIFTIKKPKKGTSVRTSGANQGIRDAVVDITGEDPTGPKTVSFNYYESILSPSVTAILSIVDTGSSVGYDKQFDSQERLGTLSSALPLAGDVEVAFKIKTKYGVLDFTDKPLLFDKTISLGSESNRESVIMNLVSGIFKKNEESSVNKKYVGNISNSVESIVKDYLKVDNLNMDNTSNSYSFLGNGKTPVEVICNIAKESIPTSGNPGYFFYETREGLNFRSIEEMIKQKPIAEYIRTDVLRANTDSDANDFKIVFKTEVRNGNLANLLKSGAIFSKNIFWNPYDFKYEEVSEDYSVQLKSTLGKDAFAPTVEDSTRTHFHIQDLGVLSRKVKEEELNNDPKFWQSNSTMRYNMLFSQIIQIQVPCNVELKAGDTILCNFDPITTSKKVQGTDPVKSGKYLIANLCHHFDPLRSFTSLTLVRDSYGLYTNKNK